MKRLINEALSDIVYHFLSISDLYTTLKTNKLHAIAAFGTDSDFDINKGRYFFFATTRSRSAGYTLGSAKLVIDGRKLNYRYKGTPLDYWGTKEISARNPNRNKTEFEDRLVLNKPEIPNANQYIFEIHIYKEKTELNSILGDIVTMANNYNIPVYFYGNRVDYLNQNKKKAYKPDFSALGETTVGNDSYIRSYIYPLLSLAAFRNQSNIEKIRAFLDEEMLANFEEEFKKNKYNKFTFGDYSYKKRDLIWALKNNIHILREDSNVVVKFVLTLIVNEMRKMGVKNFGDYVDAKMWLGRKNYKWYNKKMVGDIIRALHGVYDELLQTYSNHNYSYVVIGGKEYPHIFKVPAVISYLNRKIKLFEGIIKEIIESETEIFRYSFRITDALKNSAKIDEGIERGVFDKIEEEKYPGDAKNSVLNFIETVALRVSDEAYDITKKSGEDYRGNLEYSPELDD